MSVGSELSAFLASMPAEELGEKSSYRLAWDPASFGEALRPGFSSLWADVAEMRPSLGSDCTVLLPKTRSEALTLSAEEVEYGGGQGKTFHCHSLVLSAWSAVLRTSLSEKWATRDEGESLRVELCVGSPEECTAMLRFMYTGALTLTPTNVVGLLQLADFYGVQPIKRACGDYLFDVLGESQLPALLDMAEAYTVKRLRQRCAQVLADDFEDLIDDGQLWALSPDLWIELLSQTHLAVTDESTVLDAVLEFGSRASGPREELLAKLLPCVRFPLLKQRLLEVEQDESIMAIPGVQPLVAAAFRVLAFPDKSTRGDPLQATPRVNLFVWDEDKSAATMHVSEKRRTITLPLSPTGSTTGAGGGGGVNAAGNLPGNHFQQQILSVAINQHAARQQFSYAVVGPPIQGEGSWIIRVDSFPPALASIVSFFDILIVDDSELKSMTPTNQNPRLRNMVAWVLNQDGINGVLSSTSGVNHIAEAGICEEDVIRVDLKQRGSAAVLSSTVSFAKNGKAVGPPVPMLLRPGGQRLQGQIVYHTQQGADGSNPSFRLLLRFNLQRLQMQHQQQMQAVPPLPLAAPGGLPARLDLFGAAGPMASAGTNSSIPPDCAVSFSLLRRDPSEEETGTKAAATTDPKEGAASMHTMVQTGISCPNCGHGDTTLDLGTGSASCSVCGFTFQASHDFDYDGIRGDY